VGEVDDVVELGELAAVVGGREGLELLVRLAAEVAAVDEEEDPPGAALVDQAVEGRDGGEGLAGAGGHLDEGAGAAVADALLEVDDGADLGGPHAGGVEGRRATHAALDRGGRLRVGLALAAFELGGEPIAEDIRAVEGEDAAGACVGIEAVGEEGLDAGALVEEGERPDRDLESGSGPWPA
jgi:hypothetical protein